MSLLVTIASRNGIRRRYQIKEDADGKFWYWKVEYLEHGEFCFHRDALFLAGMFLEPADVEEFTGLHCPAAWDRVREMVQDSGVWRLPEEK